MPTISVVVPLYNEEETFGELLERLTTVLSGVKYQYEVIFINDGSTDKTAELLDRALEKNSSLRAVHFSRNFGHQSAVTAGIDHATGDAVLVMDADLQDPPELIPDFIKKYEEGFDVVYAVRGTRKESIIKRLSYYLFYRLITRMTPEVSLPHDAGDFALIGRNVADVLRGLPERNRYVRGLRAWSGFKQTGIRYERQERFAGQSKYSYWKLFKLAYDGIFSFSYMPLLLVTMLGFLFSVVAFIGIFVVLYFKLFGEKDIPGFASIAIFVLCLGGAQLLALGVVGEYIRRIYDETKQRPTYIISKKKGF
ncbi:MAG: glycosyltransferase family 2 protein [Candidatus Paceibacterota bacterium]